MGRSDGNTLNAAKHIAVYAKVVGIQTSLLVQSLSYHDVKRMISIDDDEVVHAGDDPLSSLLVDGITQLSCSDEYCEIHPIASISALFDTGDLQRSLKPRLFMAISLRDNVQLVGCVTTCLFLKDSSLGTDLFSHSYCSKNSLPRFSNWLFVDIVASRAKPSGGLLLVHAILQCCRLKLHGCCAVAVSNGGHKLLKSLNFSSYKFKEHGSVRHMCYLRTQDISFKHIKQHLKFAGSERIIDEICWRDSLSTRALSSLVGRC